MKDAKNRITELAVLNVKFWKNLQEKIFMLKKYEFCFALKS